MKVRFQIVRQMGDRPPTVQHYPLDVEPTTTILDCLNQIKWEQDGTLAFRKNCRNTICGSCGMRVNGRSALACKENVGEVLKTFPSIPSHDGVPTVAIAPLGNLPVIKDLIVDMKPFWNHLEAVDPYVSSQARQVPERETLQTPEERAKLDAAGNCILCGACYSACNAREVNPNFVGPHALAKAQRMVDDTRDQTTVERLDQYSSTDGVWGCTRCYNCNDVCPMEVAPLDRISQIKSAILARSTAETSRPIRHRKVLVEMVKSGGWVDERQFAVRVVGHGFRDWRGLLGLGPVGLRMLVKGKFPFTFEPSEGTGEVRGLIESVQRDRPDPNPPSPSERA